MFNLKVLVGDKIGCSLTKYKFLLNFAFRISSVILSIPISKERYQRQTALLDLCTLKQTNKDVIPLIFSKHILN